MLPILQNKHDEVVVMPCQVFASVCDPVRIRFPGLEDLLVLPGDEGSRVCSDMLLGEFDYFILRGKLPLFWMAVCHVESTCGRKAVENSL